MIWAEKIIEDLSKFSPEGKVNFIKNNLDTEIIEAITGINICSIARLNGFDCCTDHGCSKCKELFLKQEFNHMQAMNSPRR